MDMNGIYGAPVTAQTSYRIRSDRDSLQSQRYDYSYDNESTVAVISDTEARAITNKQLLESLGVQFKKTELDNGCSRIDRVRHGKVEAYYILDEQGNKLRYANQIDGDTIGTLTFYQKDGKSESAILQNVKPYGDFYKAEKATIFKEGGYYSTSKYEDCIFSLPEDIEQPNIPIIQEKTEE